MYALCLLSEPAVKEWNIHDLCVRVCACVCAEVLKTFDGFPSRAHVRYSPSTLILLLTHSFIRPLVIFWARMYVPSQMPQECAFALVKGFYVNRSPWRCSKTCLLHTYGGLAENNTPVNVFIWLHSTSTASFYLTIIIPRPASFPGNNICTQFPANILTLTLPRRWEKYQPWNKLTWDNYSHFWCVKPVFVRFLIFTGSSTKCFVKVYFFPPVSHQTKENHITIACAANNGSGPKSKRKSTCSIDPELATRLTWAGWMELPTVADGWDCKSEFPFIHLEKLPPESLNRVFQD